MQLWWEVAVQVYGAYDDVQPEGERAWRSGPGRGREPVFIGAVALSTSPGAMRATVGQALRALRARWPDRASLRRLQHLHFQAQKPDEQLIVLRTLADHMTARRVPISGMLMIAVLPISVFATNARKESMYIEGTGWILRQLHALVPTDADLQLTLDDPVGGNREKKARLRSALLNLASPVWTPGSLAIEFAHKEDERLIQWADYVAGAALQRRLRSNSAPWDVIGAHVIELPTSALAVGELQRRRP